MIRAFDNWREATPKLFSGDEGGEGGDGGDVGGGGSASGGGDAKAKAKCCVIS